MFSATYGSQWTAAVTALLVLLTSTSLTPEVTGEPVKFGQHAQPAQVSMVTMQGMPEPQEFFHRFVVPGVPLLMKSAAKAIPAYSLWTDEYLAGKLGNLSVEIEHGKKEKRGLKKKDVKLSEFVEEYKKKYSDFYMVQDVQPQMKTDLSMLRPMQCGGYSLETSIAWFSSGGTNSVLHTDDMENLNCMLDGHKDIVFIDKAHYETIANHEGWNDDGSFHSADIDNFNSTRYPYLAATPFFNVKLDKGDCLYIPYRWFHVVRSSKSRNLATNLWFSPQVYFNSKKCGPSTWNNDTKTYIYKESDTYKISDYSSLDKWNFTESEFMTSVNLKYALFYDFRNMDKIDKKIIAKTWTKLLNEVSMVQIKDLAKNLADGFDSNNDGIVDWEEYEAFNVLQFLSEHDLLFNDNDGLSKKDPDFASDVEVEQDDDEQDSTSAQVGAEEQESEDNELEGGANEQEEDNDVGAVVEVDLESSTTEDNVESKRKSNDEL